MKAVANLMGGVHAKLTSDNGDVSLLLKKFDWCVGAAKALPKDHAECPTALRLIVEGRVPKSPGDGSKVLKNPVSDLSGLDEGVLGQFGLPMWPLLMAWRDNGKVFVRNTGIGSVQGMCVVGVDGVADGAGTGGMDIGPGQEALVGSADSATAVITGFTKYGKNLSCIVQVGDKKPPGAESGKPPMPTESRVEAALEAIHTGVQQLTSQTGSLSITVEGIGQDMGGSARACQECASSTGRTRGGAGRAGRRGPRTL